MSDREPLLYFGEFTEAEMDEARRCAVEAMKKYGDLVGEEYERFLENPWNDHCSVQAAMRALHSPLRILPPGESDEATVERALSHRWDYRVQEVVGSPFDPGHWWEVRDKANVLIGARYSSPFDAKNECDRLCMRAALIAVGSSAGRDAVIEECAQLCLDAAREGPMNNEPGTRAWYAARSSAFRHAASMILALASPEKAAPTPRMAICKSCCQEVALDAPHECPGILATPPAASDLRERARRIADTCWLDTSQKAALCRKIQCFAIAIRAEAKAEAQAEIDRLNKWADGFSDAQLKERRLYEERIREITAERDAALALAANRPIGRDGE